MRALGYISVAVLLTASCVGEIEPTGDFRQFPPSTGTGGAAGSSSTDAASPNRDAGFDATDPGDPEPGILKGITRAHNEVRATVGVAGLTWDPTIAATAATYAAKCVFQHSGTPGLGENLRAYAPPGGHPPSAPGKGSAAAPATSASRQRWPMFTPATARFWSIMAIGENFGTLK